MDRLLWYIDVERIGALVERAEARFRALKLRNVRARHADGNAGWLDQAPYDGIMVTAAARHVPTPLYEQLADGGRMVVPVGGDAEQALMIVDRTEDGYVERRMDPVRFVPMLRGTTG